MLTKDVVVTGSAVPNSPLPFLVDTQLKVEKLRVAIQVRHSHLARNDRIDKDTEKVLEMLQAVESFIDGRVADDIQDHPAYPWFSRVKGIGKENIGKIVGLIDIHKADSVSSLWKYAGYHVVNGKAPKRERGGGKLEYNSQLRTMCWRVATSLMKGGGKFYELYVSEKTRLLEKYAREGKKVVPTAALPSKDKKKYEPEGIISEGHVHNQALRKMIKIFLSCLWQVWREAEGLPVRSPYVLEHVSGHTDFINAWEMVDREEKKLKRPRPRKAS